ncbi:MAG TPA: hypothetical protein PKA82_05305 [Pyrinomonadaceae bacterium]|nr:hypothetical protein [Pyrinomonadaceae bacterium]
MSKNAANMTIMLHGNPRNHIGMNGIVLARVKKYKQPAPMINKI